MAAVENLCTRAIWLEGGRIRHDGPASEIIQKYMAANVSSNAGSADLQNVSGRQGDGQVRYTHVEVLGPDERPLPIIRAGDSLILRFRYLAAAELTNLNIGFRLYSELGTLVTETNTRLHDIELGRVLPGSGYIDLAIDALNLMPGSYLLTLGIRTIDGPVHDVIESGFRLDVEPGRIYNTGRITDGRHGLAFFPQRWKLEGMPRGL
jgi:lipopolysaccharide transport system ATP-binding protein